MSLVRRLGPYRTSSKYGICGLSASADCNVSLTTVQRLPCESGATITYPCCSHLGVPSAMPTSHRSRLWDLVRNSLRMFVELLR